MRHELAIGFSSLLILAAGLGPAADRACGPDDFGYEVRDQLDTVCSYGFVDISASGVPVTFVAAGAEAAQDEGGAVIALAEEFELYGEPVSAVVMSSNGYLAVAGSLASEDGADFGNDVNLPAVPDNEAAEPARLFVYHDDLSGAASGGSARYQYFSACPRPSDFGLVEACTVFQWTNWGFAEAGNVDVFSFQALLYHTSFEIVFQVGTGDTSAGASATFGIQSRDARTALQYACNEPVSVPGGTAACFFEPRFPATGPVADLDVVVAGKQATAAVGDELPYQVELGNSGPAAVSAASLDVDFGSGLQCSWSCLASAGSSCGIGAGNGDLHRTDIVLLAGGRVALSAQCTVLPATPELLVVAAQASVPAGWTDLDGSNNAASDTATLSAPVSLVFSDDFENGNTQDWSRVVP